MGSARRDPEPVHGGGRHSPALPVLPAHASPSVAPRPLLTEPPSWLAAPAPHSLSPRVHLQDAQLGPGGLPTAPCLLLLLRAALRARSSWSDTVGQWQKDFSGWRVWKPDCVGSRWRGAKGNRTVLPGVWGREGGRWAEGWPGALQGQERLCSVSFCFVSCVLPACILCRWMALKRGGTSTLGRCVWHPKAGPAEAGEMPREARGAWCSRPEALKLTAGQGSLGWAP